MNNKKQQLYDERVIKSTAATVAQTPSATSHTESISKTSPAERALVGCQRAKCTCAVCLCMCVLSGLNGSEHVRRHGPLKSPFPRSGQPSTTPKALSEADKASPSVADNKLAPATIGLAQLNPEDVFWPESTVRIVPGSLVQASADSLARTLRAVCEAPDSVGAWSELILLAKRRLVAPENRIGLLALKKLLLEQLTGEGAERREPESTKRGTEVWD